MTKGAGALRAPGASSTRTRLAILLTATMAVSAIMPFVLGALGPALTEDLGLTRNQLGALSATHYLVGAVLSASLGGRIDGIAPRVALTSVFIGGGATLALMAAAPSFALLLVVLVPAGAVAAAGNPASNKVIAGLTGRRGVLTGLKQSGVHVGGLASGAVLPPLTALVGWRGAMACLGAACMAGAALVRWLPAAGTAVGSIGGSSAPPQSPTAFRRLVLYVFFMGVGLSAIMAFVPLYGAERVGLGNTAAGMLLAVTSVGGIALAPLWGAWSERRVDARGHAAAPLLALAVSAVAATALIAAAESLGAWALWAGAVVMGLGGASWNAVVMQILISQGPAGTAGRSSGRVMSALFAGLLVSAPAFGALVDATHDYVLAWVLVAGAFAAAAVFARPAGDDRTVA